MSFLPQVVAFGGVNYTGLRNWESRPQPNYLQGLPPIVLRVNELALAPAWVLGFGLKWEIFSMNKLNRMKEAKIARMQIRNQLEDGREKLQLLLEKKQVENTVQLKQIAIAEQQQKIAENALASAESQYQNGLISISDRLSVENDFVKMNQQKTQAIVDQRKAAIETMMVAGNLIQNIQYK